MVGHGKTDIGKVKVKGMKKTKDTDLEFQIYNLEKDNALVKEENKALKEENQRLYDENMDTINKWEEALKLYNNMSKMYRELFDRHTILSEKYRMMKELNLEISAMGKKVHSELEEAKVLIRGYQEIVNSYNKDKVDSGIKFGVSRSNITPVIVEVSLLDDNVILEKGNNTNLVDFLNSVIQDMSKYCPKPDNFKSL